LTRAMTSVAGFDIGNDCSCVALARKRGIDVLMNKESKRETATAVSFNDKRRYMGGDAAQSMSMNMRNTIRDLRRLIGKRFACPDVQVRFYPDPWSFQLAAHHDAWADLPQTIP